MKPATSLTITRVLALIFVLAITISIFIFREKLQGLEAYGYPGIFILSILANATVILPVPGVVLTSAMGVVFNPLGVAIAAGSGAALGELSGYLAGFSGQAVVENNKYYDRLTAWMRKYGDITVLLLAFIPNPAFDLAGMISGTLKMPVYRFLFWCWLGKVAKMLLFAYAGASVIKLFDH